MPKIPHCGKDRDVKNKDLYGLKSNRLNYEYDILAVFVCPKCKRQVYRYCQIQYDGVISPWIEIREKDRQKWLDRQKTDFAFNGLQIAEDRDTRKFLVVGIGNFTALAKQKTENVVLKILKADRLSRNARG